MLYENDGKSTLFPFPQVAFIESFYSFISEGGLFKSSPPSGPVSVSFRFLVKRHVSSPARWFSLFSSYVRVFKILDSFESFTFRFLGLF